MTSLYFRITEPPDPARFDDGWVEIASGQRFRFDRRLWRSAEVSRDPERCVTLRFDAEDGTWVIRNRASGRVLVLEDGENRYDLRTSMSVEIGPGQWRGTLTGAFTFALTHVRPPLGPVRAYDPSAAVPLAEVREPVSNPPTGDDKLVVTLRDTREERARSYLARHPLKRLALALMWRQHLEHTAGIAEDLTSATVARAFAERAPTITGWREELAMHVYGERGHQGAIRDFVLHHRLLTRTDVEEADRYVRGRSGAPACVTPRPGAARGGGRGGTA